MFTDTLRVKVESIHIFPTYLDSFKVLNFALLIPDAVDVSSACAVYEEFYSISKQKELGVYVFGISVLQV